jgi:hypothetical protein
VEPICTTLRAWLDRRGMLLSAPLVTRLLRVGALVEDAWSTYDCLSWCVARPL